MYFIYKSTIYLSYFRTILFLFKIFLDEFDLIYLFSKFCDFVAIFKYVCMSQISIVDNLY